MGSMWRAGRRTPAEFLTRETQQWARAAARSTNSADIGAPGQVVLTIPPTELLIPSTYVVDVELKITGNTAGDMFQLEVREDDISGASLVGVNWYNPFSGIAIAPFPVKFEVPIPVTVPTTKAYVVVATRSFGGGLCRIHTSSKAVIRRVGDDEVVKFT